MDILKKIFWRIFQIRDVVFEEVLLSPGRAKRPVGGFFNTSQRFFNYLKYFQKYSIRIFIKGFYSFKDFLRTWCGFKKKIRRIFLNPDVDFLRKDKDFLKDFWKSWRGFFKKGQGFSEGPLKILRWIF